MSMFDLSGMTALVTGASGGIGSSLKALVVCRTGHVVRIGPRTGHPALFGGG